MRFALLLTLLAAVPAFGQSGRVKPKETPSPTPAPVRRPVYVPAPARPRVAAPVPTPTPAAEDEDFETVSSVLVPIPVSVTDASGRPVTNLKIGDFELEIDGKKAEIGDLARSETPIRLAMLFDNSGSVLVARDFERRAAVRFFRQVMRPEKDLAALFSVARTTVLEQPMTRDVDGLIRAIESFPAPDGGTALLDGLVTVAKYLVEVPGRRVIVIVSDGADNLSDSSLDQAIRAVQSANCQVYVVKTTDFENFIRTGSRVGNANIRQLPAERRMMEIARQTGGAVYSPVDEAELNRAFQQIAADLSQQYVLSHYPENESDKRGQFRTIELTVPSRRDVIVRTRKGYYVPR